MLTQPFQRWLFVGFVALLLNSAYLAAFADPSLWYYANVAVHPILGLALAVAIAKKGTGVIFGPERPIVSRPFSTESVDPKMTPVPFFGAVALGGSVTVSDGKIAESWVIFDAMGLMQQLGLMPSAGAPA